MLGTAKKKPKKTKPGRAPQGEKQMSNSRAEKEPKKSKKTVRVKEPNNQPEDMTDAESKPLVKKMPKAPQTTDIKPESKKKSKIKPKSNGKAEDKVVLKEKKEKKKIEPKVPVDARVIDVAFEEEVPQQITTKAETTEKRDERINYLTGKGMQHPVHELIQNLRNILINSGFNELENSFFLADTDVMKQHDVNPNLVFDKVYYLAESQRPVVNLSQEQIEELQRLVPKINIDKLNDVLNEYKDNKLENYQIFQRLMADLKLSNDQITKILEIIPGLNESNPKLTNITLRSAMASSWFQTLAAIMDKENLPIKVFSTGIWFKRGLKLNELKLSSHYGASCIIMDKKIMASNGKVIAEEILNRLGFKNLEFKDSHKTQNFNITSDEIGIFINGIEIGTFGLFSKEVLQKYNIDIPILYINFGLEHMVMVQKGFDDIRELMFPQFYKAWKLNDAQIAESLQFIMKPKTEVGKGIAKNLVKVCERYGSTASPCEFKVWDGVFNSNNMPDKTPKQTGETITPRLIVKVFNHEKDSKLCGPAYLNEIVVKDGDIFGVQNNDENNELKGGQHTNIRYLDAFSKLVGSTIESKIADKLKKKAVEINIGIIKEMEDINLQLDGGALRYLLTNNKKIDVRGPMFINVECKLVLPGAKNNKVKNH
jgi:O-phosphoseryl-tRNA synthetase